MALPLPSYSPRRCVIVSVVSLSRLAAATSGAPWSLCIFYLCYAFGECLVNTATRSATDVRDFGDLVATCDLRVRLRLDFEG